MIVLKFPYSQKIYSVKDTLSEKCVRFVSFDETRKLDFTGKLTEISRETLLDNEIFSDRCRNVHQRLQEETPDQYKEKIHSVISFIKKENLKKLVISRQKQLPYSDISPNGRISLTRSFLNLCESYPNAFAYFFMDSECWMGAFSELLGRFNKKTSLFETMSLAGTIPVGEDWTEKEIEEQKPVSDYIAEILQKFSTEVTSSGTYDHLSGNIKHLRTDFTSKIKADDLESLISELHPTPAVCGIPTEKCRNAIRSFEGYDRKFYSGYIRVETDDEIQYFVNLRCAQFMQDHAILYVGGGITALSDPDREWSETELKAQAIRNNLTV